MKDQRITTAAAQAVYGMANLRAEVSVMRTGYGQIMGIDDMGGDRKPCDDRIAVRRDATLFARGTGHAQSTG